MPYRAAVNHEALTGVTSVAEVVEARTRGLGLEAQNFPAVPTQLDVERACEQLARCQHVDEAKSVRDKAAAIAIYMRSRKAGLEAQNYAAEIVLHAERRIGELTREAPKAEGGRPAKKTGYPREPVSAPTLADAGLTKKQSMQWQAMASIPEKDFEEYIASTKAKGKKHREPSPRSLTTPP